MTFDNSLIRSAHTLRHTFIRFKYDSQITRQQVIFLAYLIETGHTKDFLTRSVVIQGLSWELANQYLKALQKIRYSTKKGRLWSITEEGMRYYSTFHQEFIRRLEGPFCWR